MTNKLLLVFILVLFVSSCTSVSISTPPTTPTRSSLLATSPSTVPVSSPAVTPSATVAVENLLAQQVKDDLSAHPRPACQAGTHNEKDWADYGQGLAPVLGKLFSDARGQSLSSQTLIGIFEQGSGLSLDAVAGNSDAVLVTIIKANCNNPTGGGDSPAAPRDYVYVVNRRAGIWQIAQVASVLNAVWSVDHWIALVTKTAYGGGAGFEIGFVSQTAGDWKYDTKFQFTQSASQPMPRLSADGLALTLYSPPAACNLPKNISDPNPMIESDYKWQNGQYQCVASRVIPVPAPTRHP